MLQIDVNEADSRLFKDADAGLFGFLAMTDSVTLEAAMDRTAGERAIHATSHHFDDIVERQLQRRPQFADQGLFDSCQLRRQLLRPVRVIADRSAAAPAAYRRLADAEFCCQFPD
jgi:hypothetical protein